MMNGEKIPEWAIDEALKRCGVDLGEKPFSHWRDQTYARAVELFAAHIAAHEEPPKLAGEAKRIVEREFPDAAPENEWALVRMAYEGIKRGMELAGQQP